MKKYSILFTSMILAMSLCACGSSGSSSYKASESYAYDEPAYATTEEAVAGGYYAEDAYEEAYDEDYASDDMYASGANGAMKEAPAESSGTEGEVKSSGRKLIKTVNLSAQTKEFDNLIATVTERIDSLGGYAEQMDVSGYTYRDSDTSVRTAYIVARIPANRLDSFIVAVSDNSNIISRNESTNDVTLEYSDVEARISSLRVEQKRLDELLSQADSLETIIALEDRLTEVRYELESYESRLRNMDNRVDYSTVYLDVQEVRDYTPVVTTPKTFWQRLGEGFVEGCEDAIENLGDFIIGFISILPGLIVFLIILAIIVFVIFLIVKLIIKSVKKSASKRASQKKTVVTTTQTVQTMQTPQANSTSSGEDNATK